MGIYLVIYKVRIKVEGHHKSEWELKPTYKFSLEQIKPTMKDCPVSKITFIYKYI